MFIMSYDLNQNCKINVFPPWLFSVAKFCPTWQDGVANPEMAYMFVYLRYSRNPETES